MLWDIIRDFIVQYITGGHLSTGEQFSASIGAGIYSDGSLEGLTTDQSFFPIGNIYLESLYNDPVKGICFGDWLATTLTIFCMCLIVVFFIWLVRWVFKAVSSAFLLK